jgi:hypothetical protein
MQLATPSDCEHFKILFNHVAGWIADGGAEREGLAFCQNRPCSDADVQACKLGTGSTMARVCDYSSYNERNSSILGAPTNSFQFPDWDSCITSGGAGKVTGRARKHAFNGLYQILDLYQGFSTY